MGKNGAHETRAARYVERIGRTPHDLMFGRGIAIFPDDLFPGSVKFMVTRENAANLETLWDRTKQIVSKVLDQLAMRDSDFKIMLNNSIGMHLSHVVDSSSDVASIDELDVESGDSDDLCSNHCGAASTNDGQNRSRKFGPWAVVDDCCIGDRDIETDAEVSPWAPGVDVMKISVMVRPLSKMTYYDDLFNLEFKDEFDGQRFEKKCHNGNSFRNYIVMT